MSMFIGTFLKPVKLVFCSNKAYSWHCGDEAKDELDTTYVRPSLFAINDNYNFCFLLDFVTLYAA